MNGGTFFLDDVSITNVSQLETSPFSAIIAPASQLVGLGGISTFTVQATGTPPLSYYWQFNGTNLTKGGNIFISPTGTLTVSNVTSANEGLYSVTVSNVSGEASSADAVLTFQSQQAQDLILNGSFELPVVSANTFQSATPTFWSWGGGTSGVMFHGSVPSGYGGFAAYWPPPENEQQFVDIGPNSYGPLSQTFTVTNQGTYELNWFDSAGQSGGLKTAPYSVTIVTGAMQTVASNSFDAYNATSDWVERSILLTLSPGTYTLKFVGLNAYGGLNALIDNVTLVQPSIFQPGTIIAWDNPAPITYGTALSASELDATANIPGSFAYNPTNGTVLPAGSNTLSVIFTPTNTINYSSLTDSVSIFVLKATPAVTWPSPSVITPGTALSDSELDATANVPGSFAYNPTNGTVLPAGSYTLFVIFTPTDTLDFTSATDSVGLVVSSVKTYDLTANFSTNSNPNGVWSYDENNVPITQRQIPSYGAGWGYYGTEDSSILQLTVNPGGNDSQVGDVVMHAPSVPNGGPTSYLDINWASPANGVISITGRAWDDVFAADRDANWWLSVGGTTIASRGSVYGLHRSDGAAQFSNNLLPGYSLTGIGVTQGEVVQIAVAADTYYGHFVGVEEDIVLSGIAPVIQTAQQTANSITFTWSALTNQLYQIQSTTSLAPANWTNLGDSFPATNSTMTISEPIGTNVLQFFRVALLP
jgi:hypothetical protein